jgi:glucose dehydrogenase
MAGSEISKDKRTCTCTCRTVSKHAYISYGAGPHPTLYLCKIIHVFLEQGDLLIVALREGLDCLLGGWDNYRGSGVRLKLYLYQ